jgi:beta-galactosidase
LLQQSTNIQEAHNDNFNTPAFADGYWVMFDYNRGYADDLEASGIMSINRLPKFSYYFFQSQRDADEQSPLYNSGPMVFIASYWDQHSDLNVRVFSNCEEVELLLNDRMIARQFPDANRISGNLNHPPFTFKLDRFIPGKLSAIGYIKGKEAARHIIYTPQKPIAIELIMDESGRPPKGGVNDVIFIYARLVDAKGTLIQNHTEMIEFSLNGDAKLISPAIIKTTAGVATALISIGDTSGEIIINARTPDLQESRIIIK